MSELISVGFCVAETGALEHGLNRSLFAGQEMPAFSRSISGRNVRFLLGRRRLRTFKWIDAHHDDFKIAARFQRDCFYASGESIQNLRAEHRAAVISEQE